MGYQSAPAQSSSWSTLQADFFFLEVNTRLQVEHPVTEEVTGIDLVREQLRVAEASRWAMAKTMCQLSGHAIEARLYAEDPDNGFFPRSATSMRSLRLGEPVVRWDSGIEQGSDVGVDFDPMIWPR